MAVGWVMLLGVWFAVLYVLLYAWIDHRND